jgi:N-acetylmuramoyl-L-alanine amidase
MRRCLLCVLSLILSMLFSMALADSVRVAVDPAHGGDDSGSRAGAVVEKDWNLRFGRAIVQQLKAEGIEASLIREKDESLTIEERVERIHSLGPKLVLVIHADREATGTRSGPLLVVQPPTSGTTFPGLPLWGWMSQDLFSLNVHLARILARHLDLSGEFHTLSDRSAFAREPTSWEGGILCAPHAHLRYLAAPAVVLTPLFLTSKSDIQKYASEEAVADYARKVAKAVKEYIRHDAGEKG